MFRATRNNSLLTLSASALIPIISPSAQADTTHDTHIACYASVDVQCKKASCSKDDKNWGYNQCD
jgi:hypothetical protein